MKTSDERLKEIATALETKTYAEVCQEYRCSRSTAAKAQAVFGGRISPFERFVLNELRQNGPLSKQRLARHIGLKQPIVQAAVKKLVERGVAAKTPTGLWQAAA